MGIRKFFHQLFQEGKILMGEGTKDKIYKSQNVFPDEETAAREFKRSKAKLFDVNRWSNLPGITSTFELYDNKGVRSQAKKLQQGYFIRILLPAPTPENWVEVTDKQEREDVAEFTVNPCRDPQENEEDVEHFFIKEASSTFKVELHGQSIHAFEIGKNEGVNNREKEAGNRKLLNTVLALGGWTAFQELQWKKLTEYLVHLHEIVEEV